MNVLLDGGMIDYCALPWYRRVRYWREQRGIKACELSRLIGTRSTYVNELESGRRPSSSIPTLLALAAALGVTPGVLLDSHPTIDRNLSGMLGRPRILGR